MNRLQRSSRWCLPKGRIVSVQHLGDLQEEIEGHYRQGMFDEEFYQTWITRFAFSPPDSLPGARSLIVVAMPQPQIRVVFTWNGERRPLFIPPTYVGYDETNKQVEDLLTGILGPAGYCVTQATLPMKLLAVRSGLGAYGKNNICYVPGMGSFHQLAAFYSDLVCQEDTWQELQMMESCQNCSACLRSCPTGAIPSATPSTLRPFDRAQDRLCSGQAGLRAGLRTGTSERFLVRAERCITFHNERAGDFPFPAWLDPSWHNCLIGCLDCQRVCPQNKDFLEWVEEGAEFSQEETALLLEGVPLDQLPAATVRKLEQIDFAEFPDVLPRNLGVFVRR
jgi:epoxyqueuosine reductase